MAFLQTRGRQSTGEGSVSGRPHRVLLSYIRRNMKGSRVCLFGIRVVLSMWHNGIQGMAAVPGCRFDSWSSTVVKESSVSATVAWM